MKKFTLFIVAIFFVIDFYAQDVPAEIASAKPNNFIKGELLADRIQRIVNDGNYIGIVFSHENCDPKYAGKAYDELGNILVEKTKKYLKIENVELIDISKVPKTDKVDSYYAWHKKYRFWDTKYKVVLWFNTSVGIKTAKSTSEEDKASGRDYRISKFQFDGNINIHEFYLKKGKEKTNAIGSNIYVGLTSNEIKSIGAPSDYQLSKIVIPNENDIMRIVQNNMEVKLT